MIRDLIGSRSNKVKIKVERGMIKKFTEAIGDLSPIFIDEETGRKSRYGRNIAPPTFPRVFDFGEIAGLELPEKGLIHGEQTYRYCRPLEVGETIYCFKELKDCYEKKGMLFVVIKGYGETVKGEKIFSFEQIILITKTVRKEYNI